MSEHATSKTKQFDLKIAEVAHSWVFRKIFYGFTQATVAVTSIGSDRKMYWTISVETLRQAIFALLICKLNKNDSSVHLANCVLIILH